MISYPQWIAHTVRYMGLYFLLYFSWLSPGSFISQPYILHQTKEPQILWILGSSNLYQWICSLPPTFEIKYMEYPVNINLLKLYTKIVSFSLEKKFKITWYTNILSFCKFCMLDVTKNFVYVRIRACFKGLKYHTKHFYIHHCVE